MFRSVLYILAHTRARVYLYICLRGEHTFLLKNSIKFSFFLCLWWKDGIKKKREKKAERKRKRRAYRFVSLSVVFGKIFVVIVVHWMLDTHACDIMYVYAELSAGTLWILPKNNIDGSWLWCMNSQTLLYACLRLFLICAFAAHNNFQLEHHGILSCLRT